MDSTHVHLLVTHLPVFGSILGGIVLVWGLWKRSDQTNIAAYYVLIISSIGAVISYLTGERAEERVEDIQGVAENMIGQHEDAALFALISLSVLGAMSVVGLFLAVRKSSFTRRLGQIVFLLSLVSFGLVSWTGYLGGQIRHTEIGSASSVQGAFEKN